MSDLGSLAEAALPTTVALEDPADERERALAQSYPAPGRAVIGTLVGFLEPLVPLVTYPRDERTAALSASTTVDLDESHIGDDVVLQFEDGDPSKPIIIGRLRRPRPWPVAPAAEQVQIEADGRRLLVQAQDQITFRCGQASITLTRAGKVLIQGTYVSSKSTGVNRIKGGSVQLN